MIKRQAHTLAPLSSTVRPHMKVSRAFLAPLAAVAVLAACASGSAIVTGTKRTPVTVEHVKLYLEPPVSFEVIGLVTASSDAGWSEQDSVDSAVKELKKQAAALGANGLLLASTVGSETTMVGNVPVTTKTVQGKAIFVSESRDASR
jgi:hypothetical protein